MEREFRRKVDVPFGMEMHAVPAFQIDQDGRERFVGEDQPAGRPCLLYTSDAADD